jgi:hypothetical protein
VSRVELGRVELGRVESGRVAREGEEWERGAYLPTQRASLDNRPSA